MPCPNCGDENYNAPNPCGVCQWAPSPEGTLIETYEADKPAGDSDVFMNLAGALLCGALFFLAFYILPSKRQSDWFHFQVSDVIAAAIITVIGFIGIEKAKD